MGLILASASPRRSELLSRMGLDFVVRTAACDETLDPFSAPEDEAARLSLMKAQAVRPRCNEEDVIVAADTIVVCDSLMMGKPRSESDAFSMLQRLSGREHQVMTGLTVLSEKHQETVTVTTGVRMRELSDEEIRAYIATGEPMGKAGAYAVQGLASMFIMGIDGDYYNVMGLPVCTLTTILRKCGIKPLGV